MSQVKKWSSVQKLEIVLVAIKGDMTMMISVSTTK